MKTLYLECNMGAAGDMIMSALYEVCNKREDFLAKMNELFGTYDIMHTPKTVTKCGICGTHMDVTIDGTSEVADDVVRSRYIPMSTFTLTSTPMTTNIPTLMSTLTLMTAGTRTHTTAGTRMCTRPTHLF